MVVKIWTYEDKRLLNNNNKAKGLKTRQKIYFSVENSMILNCLAMKTDKPFGASVKLRELNNESG